MTVAGTLWGDVRQRQTKVILSVAALNGFELNLSQFTFPDKPAEFTEKFTYGKIPAFEATDGFKFSKVPQLPVTVMSSIGTKVDLLGPDPKESALIDQWVHFAKHEIATPVGGIASLVYGYGAPFTREALNNYTERLIRGLKYLELHLATRSTVYVASDILSLADLVVASAIDYASRLALGTAERKQYPASFAHHRKVTADKRTRQYWGTDGFVDTPIIESANFTL